MHYSDLPHQIHHLGIAVSSVTEAEDFYITALGMKRLTPVIHDPLQKVNAVLLGYEIPGAPGPMIELVEPSCTPSPIDRFLSGTSSLFHYCIQVPDIRAALGTAKAQHAIIVQKPVPAPLFDGRNIAWILSPSGHLIEFLESTSTP